MNAALLTFAYYFDPGGAVGALRPSRFHRYLKQLGYGSKVIAAFAAKDAGDEVRVVPDTASAYWERRAETIAAGQTPEPIPFDAQIERLRRKTIYSGQFAIGWADSAIAAAEDVLRQDRSITHVFSTYPPIGNHLAGMKIARKHGLRWIADFRDPIRYGPHSASQWWVGRLEREIFEQADAIVANTEAAGERWRGMFPQHAKKIHVIWNGYDPDQPVEALPIPSRAEHVLVHAGSLYQGRNANAVIAGLERLRATGDAEAGRVRVVLAGSFDSTAGIDKDLHDKAIAAGWLDMSGKTLPRTAAQTLSQEADGLLLLQPQSTDQVPAKLFEYLCIGRPILAVIPRDSAIEWILSRAGIPYVAIYTGEEAASADAKLREFLRMSNSATAANEWFRNNFDAQRQAGQLAAIVEATKR